MALKSLPWVRKVRVIFDKKRAVVTVEAEKYNAKALLKALKKEGYRGKVVK
jgi:hypothetical protein